MPLKKDISDEEIYELREQGMSYEVISKYFDDKGLKITWETIRSRCKRIYEKKEQEEPKTKIIIYVPDEEIYELREQGKSYQEIVNYFDKKEVKVSISLVRERCKKIYEEKGEEEPETIKKSTRNDIPDEEIFELREQGTTYEEIAK